MEGAGGVWTIGGDSLELREECQVRVGNCEHVVRLQVMVDGSHIHQVGDMIQARVPLCTTQTG